MKLAARETAPATKAYRWRSAAILALVVLGALGLAARAVELQLIDHGFLSQQGDQRSMRVVKIAANPRARSARLRVAERLAQGIAA